MSDSGPRPERSYWRSLDRLLDSPALAGATPDEFPAGASLPPDGVSRRSMLQLMGASFALAGLAACRRPLEHIVPYVDPPESVVPGIARHYATTMTLGADAAGIVVESHEGRPTKIEGNALHPSSRGAATTWMQAAPLGLYDPDRARDVLRRPGPGAEPKPATWQDFAAFWSHLDGELRRSGGDGLAFLVPPTSSPTWERLVAELRQRYPQARWVVWEPVSDESRETGIREATGASLRPVYDLSAAERIVSLDADFLLTESDALRAAAGFAAGRRGTGDAKGHGPAHMSRLYVVESALSLTGANADHRIALPSGRIPHVAAALASRLAAHGVALDVPTTGPDLPADLARRIDLVARDLAASRGKAVVVAGRRQPAPVHALALAMNQALGALGPLVALHPLGPLATSRADDLASLAAAMAAGSVSTLIIVGGNPAYDAPPGLGLATALPKVAHTVRLGTHPDETAALCEWRLPRSHFLESWGDAVAAEGTASVVQPLVAPLFDSRSELELLALLGGAEQPSGHDLVRATWNARLGGDSEERWRRVLHDGLAAPEEPGPAPATAVAAAIAPGAARRAYRAAGGAAPEGLELVLTLSSAVHDGRFANNAWLQELPDPLTKLTWGNAALVSPATARRLDVGTGDVVRLTLDDATVEAPVFVLPGQADGSIALALGYGRRAAGRVGDGIGVDAYALLGRGAGLVAAGLEVRKTGKHHAFAQTQEHWDMADRQPVREASLAEYAQEPTFVAEQGVGDGEEGAVPTLWSERRYEGDPQWGMAIDLNACIGCNACITACQSENNIPVVGPRQVRNGREMLWLRVDRYFSGDPSAPEVAFQPVPCMHCENAPCEEVCPVAATVHDEAGLNLMVYNRCIGTRYCSNNCPYKVRRFNFFNYTKDTPELMKMAMNPDVTVRSRGVMEKCSYCLQRINEAGIEAKRQERPLADGEIRTACQQTCPAEAIEFGDINDPQSRVAAAKRRDRNYVLLGELHNKPRTSYLAKLRNPHPEWPTA